VVPAQMHHILTLFSIVLIYISGQEGEDIKEKGYITREFPALMHHILTTFSIVLIYIWAGRRGY
jgi:hypothetical protein